MVDVLPDPKRLQMLFPHSSTQGYEPVGQAASAPEARSNAIPTAAATTMARVIRPPSFWMIREYPRAIFTGIRRNHVTSSLRAIARSSEVARNVEQTGRSGVGFIDASDSTATNGSLREYRCWQKLLIITFRCEL